MDGHSKLEFIDIKTNITSILLSLHRFDKKTATKKNKNKNKDRQNGNLQNKKNKKNNGSITAGFWKFTKMCLSFSYREREQKKKVKVKFGRTASQWKKNNNNKAEDLQAY